MKRFTFLSGVMVFSGCSEKTDSVPPVGKQEPLIILQNHDDTSPSSGIEGPTAFRSTSTPGENGQITVDGILKGAWLRQQSGTTLGEVSKATLSNPLRLIAGGRSLALLGETEEMEQTLLKNSGKPVRLTGALDHCGRTRKGRAKSAGWLHRRDPGTPHTVSQRFGMRSH